MAFTRWAHLLALMALFGAASFGWLLNRRSLPAPKPARLWFASAVVAIVSALVQLILTAANMGGAMIDAFDPSVLAAIVQHTLFGQVFVFRFVALLALVGLTSGHSNRRFLPIAIISGAALAGVAFTSHAAASGVAAFMPLRAANDAIHLLAGGFWIGGLLLLLDLARQSKGGDTFHISVALFSEVAIYGVTALVLAGMINAGFVYAAQRVTWTYTLLLLLKVVLAGAMVVIAFINRLRLMPALEANSDAAPFARNVRTEIALGAGVVALAAILGSIPPG